MTFGAPVELLAQTTVVPLPGDANGDGSVDGTDLNTVLSNYGVTSGATWAMGDFNGDGAVDGTDLNIVLSNYGYGIQRDRRRARTLDVDVGGRGPSRSAGAMPGGNGSKEWHRIT